MSHNPIGLQNLFQGQSRFLSFIDQYIRTALKLATIPLNHSHKEHSNEKTKIKSKEHLSLLTRIRLFWKVRLSFTVTDMTFTPFVLSYHGDTKLNSMIPVGLLRTCSSVATSIPTVNRFHHVFADRGISPEPLHALHRQVPAA
jgi:hypothetical protein